MTFAIAPVLIAALATEAVPAAVPSPPAADRVVQETIVVPLFGKVSVYRPEPVRSARGLILFVSGDGGWNKGVVDMARRAAPSAVVVGLSMPAWQRVAEKSPGTCWYAAGELEPIAQAVEKTYRFPRYLRPILVGYSSGATVVYAALAQAPEGTFAGAVSLGFCPDLEVARPFCSRGDFKPAYDPKKRRSLFPARTDLDPRADGSASWIALQGDIDQVCEPHATRRFVESIPAARVLWLPKVGHGFSVPRNWGAAYDSAIRSLLEPASAFEAPPAAHVAVSSPGPTASEIGRSLGSLDLPLEVRWPDGARSAIVFVSGDGGWADIDREVAAALDRRRIAVVGWNSLRYFWNAKSPEVFLNDLARVVAAIPADVRVFAGGYSFGAEVVAASIGEGRSKVPELASRIAGLVLLAPGPFASFEVSPLDWIRTSTSPTAHPVRKTLQKGVVLPVLCLEPRSGEESGCPESAPSGLTRETLGGGHHFGGDFDAVAERIAGFIGRHDPGAATPVSGSPRGGAMWRRGSVASKRS